MSSQPARFRHQKTPQKLNSEQGKVVKTGGRYYSVFAQPRQNEVLQPQPLTDGEPPQVAPQALLRKRRANADADAEQRVKRAQSTADGLLPAEEPRTNTDSESAPFLPYIDPSGHKGRKRRRTSLGDPVADATAAEEETGETEDDWRAILWFWVREGRWPTEYFEACPDMDHLFARMKSSPSLGRKRSSSASSMTPSDQRPREEKSAPYRDSRYETLLATKGVYMDDSPLGIAVASKELCRTLLEKEQSVPQESLFRDDIFQATCRKAGVRNEVRVIRDITQLIVPPAEILATLGASHLECLIESVNEGWNNSLPLTKTRPQPDYSVGFRREAFSGSQLDKLAPFIGQWLTGDLSFFMATYYIYFPFLACEVKCGAAALDVADRQNAHSMSIAARGVVELFRLVGRESELDRQILSFSVSHDHRSVRIYGHYPVIKEKDTEYYRHLIREFSFIELDGEKKWTAYRFTKNVYDIWMPSHFERICAAIDQIPSDIDFSVDPLPGTGLSQGVESLSAAASSQSPMGPPEPLFVAPESTLPGSPAPKRPRKDA